MFWFLFRHFVPPRVGVQCPPPPGLVKKIQVFNLFVAGIWRFMGEGWLRWVVCSGILLAVYTFMAKVGMKREHFGPRDYRYAE